MGLSKKTIAAFASLQVALILIISSTIVISMLRLMPISKQNSDVKTNAQNFSRIQNAIAAYYQKYGYLPCPASRTDAANSANFGKSTDCTTAGAATGTSETGSGSDIIRIGVLPVRALNLADHDMYDSYGSRITYAVIKALAQSSTNFTNFSSSTAQIITIKDKDGTILNPNNSATAANYIPFVLISHGNDKNGAYSSAGTLIRACDTTKLQGDNCNDDNVFVKAFHNYTSGTSYYDDYIYWMSISQLKNSNGTSAKTATTCGTFLPNNLSNLLLWLDANDSTKITKDASNNVTVWTDKSSNAYSCVNGGSPTPQYSATGLNSKPTMVIDATKFGFKCNTISLTGGRNLSIFIVAQQSSTANAFYLLDLNGTAGRLTLNANATAQNFWFRQGAVTSTLSTSPTTNQYISFILNSGVVAPTRLYLNGVATGGTTTAYIAQDITATAFAIGQAYTSPAITNFSGNVSEVLIYSRTLNEEERGVVEAYLKNKWGL
jgi:hypothetical protein